MGISLYGKILIAFDGLDDSRAALNKGAELAALYKAEVVLVSVLDTGIDVAAAEAYASGSADEEQFESSRSLLDEEVIRLRQRGLAVTAIVAHGNPPEQIAEKAREVGADLVVIGHRTRGLWSRLANESVGVQLVKDPPCSILVIPPQT
jgi:nucleotide-binding universal stress UspA family protein